MILSHAFGSFSRRLGLFSGRQPERQSYNSAIYGGDYIRNINAALAMISIIATFTLLKSIFLALFYISNSSINPAWLFQRVSQVSIQCVSEIFRYLGLAGRHLSALTGHVLSLSLCPLPLRGSTNSQELFLQYRYVFLRYCNTRLEWDL